MADAGAAPAAPADANPDLAAPAWPVLPEDNPDAASDAELAACATGLVAALRSGNSEAQMKAANQITTLTRSLGLPEPPNPRTIAALDTAGAALALVQLLRVPDEVAAPATKALANLVYASEAAHRAVVDGVGFDALMQLLHDSKDKEHLHEVALLLNTFVVRSEWLMSLSLDSDVVARILAVPFIKTADVNVASCLLASVRALVKHHPSFRRAITTSHLSLLTELFAPHMCGDYTGLIFARNASKTVQLLQTHDDFDFDAFDRIGGYVSCVESLGRLYRLVALEPDDVGVLSDMTRMLSTAYDRCPALRPRLQHLLLNCPGALAGVVGGVQESLRKKEAAMHILCGFLDALHRDVPSPEAFIFDSHFAGYSLVSDHSIKHRAYKALVEKLKADWRATGSLRAIERPLQHNRLAAALALLTMCGSEVQFTRMLAAGDRLEVLVAALVELALDRFVEMPLSNSRESQMYAVVGAFSELLDKAEFAHITAPADTEADVELPAKRQRKHSSGAMLRASDVNVKRRDSTVLLIAGRPFHVNGALLETKSSVLADALSGVETLDPIAIALPNEVPEEQQYALFHAAVEHAYTGTVASDVAAESLLPLWCLGDHLQMDELCAWCVERMAPVLDQDVALLERAWTTALARPSDELGDACATAWLVMGKDKRGSWRSILTWFKLFKRVHDGCAVKELPAAQLVRVLHKAVLAVIAKDGPAAADEEA